MSDCCDRFAMLPTCCNGKIFTQNIIEGDEMKDAYSKKMKRLQETTMSSNPHRIILCNLRYIIDQNRNSFTLKMDKEVIADTVGNTRDNNKR